MKIGILTYHRAHNYGAYLQACALCNRLNEESDMQAEIIDFRMEKEAARYSYNWSVKKKIRHCLAYRFLREKQKGFERALNDGVMIRSEKYLQSDSLQDFQDFVKGKYDVIIAGSDEVWNANNFRGFPSPYWLFGELGCQKFSYAASAGADFGKMSKEESAFLKSNLNQFQYIGVREQLTYNGIAGIMGTNKKIHLCCDPSFLYDFKVKKKNINEMVGKNPRYSCKKKNAIVMTGERKLSNYLYKKLHHSYNLISVCDRHPQLINVPNLTPIEWLELLNSSDIILTTYFHATCFSIILHKPFLVFGSKRRSGKIEAILETKTLERHYIKDIDEFIRKDRWNQVCDISEELEDCKAYVESKKRSFEHFIEELRRNAV